MKTSVKNLSLAFLSAVMFIAMAFGVFVGGLNVFSAKAESQAQAKIGDQEYVTVVEAFEAVADGETIVLLDNADIGGATLTIASGKTIVVDLGTYTLSGQSDVQGHAMIINKGNVTFNGGTISYQFVGEPDTSYGKGNYTISNGGTITVNGTTIANTTAAMSHMTSAVDNNSTSGNAILVLNSGSIINENYIAIRQFANSTKCENEVIINVNLNSGKQKATAWGCDLTYEYVKINGDYRT